MDTPMTPEKRKHREERLATAVTYLTHPLFVPLAAVAVLLYGGTYLAFLPAPVKHFNLLLVSLNTLLIPAAYMHLFRRTGLISSYHLPARRERYLPVFLFALFLLITWLVLRRVRQPQFLTSLFLALAVSSALTGVITLRWKISLHLAGLGSLSGFLLAATLRLAPALIYLWLVSLLVAGITATARLVLQRHTPAETYVAFFLAFSITFLMLLL